INYLPSQRPRIAEWHQHASFFGKHLFSIPVGRRDNCLAGAQRVGERAGSDLRSVKIRSNINVRRADELDEFLQTDKSVVEDHLTLDAFLMSQPFYVQPIPFTVALDHMRMGCAKNDVNDIRMPGQNVRQS